MFIIRIVIAVILIATFVLLLGFIVTRNNKYLTLLKQLFKHVAWFFILFVLLNIISRVIKF